jgi:hypothetical protein
LVVSPSQFDYRPHNLITSSQILSQNKSSEYVIALPAVTDVNITGKVYFFLFHCCISLFYGKQCYISMIKTFRPFCFITKTSKYSSHLSYFAISCPRCLLAIHPHSYNLIYLTVLSFPPREIPEIFYPSHFTVQITLITTEQSLVSDERDTYTVMKTGQNK